MSTDEKESQEGWGRRATGPRGQRAAGRELYGDMGGDEALGRTEDGVDEVGHSLILAQVQVGPQADVGVERHLAKQVEGRWRCGVVWCGVVWCGEVW